ncbi:MAG: efflux RND transporter periplasmic adaptor subunit [Deltaproteobacteria bacterium]
MRFAKPLLKGVSTAAIFVMVVLVPLKIVPRVQQWLEDRQSAGTKHAALVQAEKLEELAEDQADTLIVPGDVQKSLGLTLAQVQSAVAPEPLKLDGELYLLSNSMTHVRSRFPGDVMEVGGVESPLAAAQGADSSSVRARAAERLQYGDFVRKGQLLAVVWSKDLGEKKSELVDGIARLRIDQERLKNLEAGLKNGSISEAKVSEQSRLVQADIIAVEKAEDTLLSWQVPKSEIAALRAEAERVRDRGAGRDVKLSETWARVEVRAFVDGTIMEMNVALGDYVTSDLDLFKIADLSRMDVMAHAYEEEMPVLERIPPNLRDWTIHLKADPDEEPLKGSFDRVLPIIDPTQHTGLVRGWVDNSRGRLRVGQFITAWINLPTPPDEVSIPVSALIDQDGQTFVFVRSKSDPRKFTRRKVFPVRRRDDVVSLSCRSRAHRSAGGSDVEPLEVGDWVVTAGGLQLAAELTYLQSQAKAEAESKAAEPKANEHFDAVQK